MILKKFYASTITEAQIKARKALGETYIVVETQKALADEPAWVHVLDSEDETEPTNTAPTYSRRDLFPKALTKIKETVSDSLQLLNMGNQQSSKMEMSMTSAEKEATETPSPPISDKIDELTSINLKKKADLNQQIKTLNKRFDRLENLVSAQTIGANAELISHPAFQQLLATGVPYTTINNWFNEILTLGIDPYHQKARFIPLLAKKIKNALDIASGTDPARYMLFTGAAGAGKSSLMMKLVLHPTLLRKANCALICVQPAERNYFYSPLPAFADNHGIAHYTLDNAQQISEWKDDWTKFDHLLFEVPEKSKRSKGLFSTANYQKFIPEDKSIETHLVINAALNPKCLENSPNSDGLPKADYIDFTHLDRAPQKGHLVPLMKKLGCKARYMSGGPQIPKDVARFEPARFARKLLAQD